jgi:hypothetical protein
MMRVMSRSRSSIVKDGMRHSSVFSRDNRGSHLDIPPAPHASPATLTATVVPASLTPTTMTMGLRVLLLLLALEVLAPAAHVVMTTSTGALLISRSS